MATRQKPGMDLQKILLWAIAALMSVMMAISTAFVSHIFSRIHEHDRQMTEMMLSGEAHKGITQAQQTQIDEMRRDVERLDEE